MIKMKLKKSCKAVFLINIILFSSADVFDPLNLLFSLITTIVCAGINSDQLFISIFLVAVNSVDTEGERKDESNLLLRSKEKVLVV